MWAPEVNFGNTVTIPQPMRMPLRLKDLADLARTSAAAGAIALPKFKAVFYSAAQSRSAEPGIAAATDRSPMGGRDDEVGGRLRVTSWRCRLGA
jgi:hypothetical protein